MSLDAWYRPARRAAVAPDAIRLSLFGRRAMPSDADGRARRCSATLV